MTGEKTQLAYGTCIALDAVAALLQGPPGSGKSDLALRFALETPAHLGAALVADDQVVLSTTGGRLLARPPATIAGKIEVRGVGIVTLPFRDEAELRLIVRLADPADIPRLPPQPPETQILCAIALPILYLAPFEASAPLKLRLALERLK